MTASSLPSGDQSAEADVRPGLRAERRPRAAPARAFRSRDPAVLAAERDGHLAGRGDGQDSRRIPSGRDSVEPTRVVKISLGFPSQAAEYTIVCPSGAKRAPVRNPRRNVSVVRFGGGASRSRRACTRWPARNASGGEAGHGQRRRGEHRRAKAAAAGRPAARRRKPRLRTSVPASRQGPAPDPWSTRTGPRGPSPDSARRPRRGSSAASGAACRSGSGSASMIAESVCAAGRSLERAPARRHLVEDRAERELVRSEVHRLAARLLGRHVADGAQDRSSFGAPSHRQLLVPREPSKARGTSLARPKSRILTNPSRVTIRFSGLRSRCTMPGGVRLGEPVRGLRRDGEQLLESQRARRRRAPGASSPSTSSMAMNDVPFAEPIS